MQPCCPTQNRISTFQRAQVVPGSWLPPGTASSSSSCLPTDFHTYVFASCGHSQFEALTLKTVHSREKTHHWKEDNIKCFFDKNPKNYKKRQKPKAPPFSHLFNFYLAGCIVMLQWHCCDCANTNPSPSSTCSKELWKYSHNISSSLAPAKSHQLQCDLHHLF